MRKPLRSLAKIRVGHSFRTGIENDPQGDIRILQIRDIKADADIQFGVLPLITWLAPGKPPLLKPGDVVLPSRGGRYDAALIRSTSPMIANGHIYILHPSGADLMPEYLCWYLNQPDSRSYILKNLSGTSIPTLSRQVLEHLSIPVPALKTQRKIVELQQLWQQEQSLVQQLMTNRQKLLYGVFDKFLES